MFSHLMEIINGMIWLSKTLMDSSGASSVKQVGLKAMVPILNLKPPVHTITQRQGGRNIGEQSQASIIAKFIEVGYNVLTPYGDNQRYDLVIEDADGQFWRVQCKTGRSNGENIVFTAVSLYYHTRAGRTANGSRPYHGQIEYFAVYYPETRGVYLIPIDHTGVSQMTLRLILTKNKQETNIRTPKDYEI